MLPRASSCRDREKQNACGYWVFLCCFEQFTTSEIYPDEEWPVCKLVIERTASTEQGDSPLVALNLNPLRGGLTHLEQSVPWTTEHRTYSSEASSKRSLPLRLEEPVQMQGEHSPPSLSFPRVPRLVINKSREGKVGHAEAS